ncbi:hypothetical protein KR067_010706 [Drosophila pandora]|nr:hypothetical protein KR067_010706 [Drosophila pandora]
MAKYDPKAYIRDELSRKLKDKRNFIIESDRAVVIKADFPKSQYHFRVVAKEELRDVTQLNGDHLPLLDHLMDLAHEVIEKQDHLEPHHFRIGFKVNTFWNRLNLHVISDDFYSVAMKYVRHWNSFNSELFMPFHVAHLMLSLQGSIDPISEEKCKELKLKLPLHCNQCEFETNLLLDLKLHLFQHWQGREREREQKKNLDKILKMLETTSVSEDATLNASEIGKESIEMPQKPLATPLHCQAKDQAANGYAEYVSGPPVNMMNIQNPNNPFRNTPPLNIKTLASKQPNHSGNHMAHGPRGAFFKPRGNMAPRAPRPMWNAPRGPQNHQHNSFMHPGINGFGAPTQHQGYQPVGRGQAPMFGQPMGMRHPGFNSFRPPPPTNYLVHPTPPNQTPQNQQLNQTSVVSQAASTSQGARPKWNPQNANNQNRQAPTPNSISNQGNPTEKNLQNPNQSNRPYQNKTNKKSNKKPQNPNQKSSQKKPNSNVNQPSQTQGV